MMSVPIIKVMEMTNWITAIPLRKIDFPVPERTLSPMLPDSDAHLLSLGLGYAKNHFSIDTSSMVVFFNDRHTRRNIDGLNGKYTSTTITFLVSFSYAF